MLRKSVVSPGLAGIDSRNRTQYFFQVLLEFASEIGYSSFSGLAGMGFRNRTQ
jgi:hypothetical protein